MTDGLFTKGASDSRLAESGASLEEALQAERDNRRTERFLWVSALSIVTLAQFAATLPWYAMLMVFVLTLVLLIGMASWCGVEAVAVPLDRCLNRYLAHAPGKPLPAPQNDAEKANAKS